MKYKFVLFSPQLLKSPGKVLWSRVWVQDVIRVPVRDPLRGQIYRLQSLGLRTRNMKVGFRESEFSVQGVCLGQWRCVYLVPAVLRIQSQKADLTRLISMCIPGLRETIAKIPNTQPLNFLGSCSLVGIGKFDLLFLWLIGVVRTRSILNPRPSTLSETNEQEKDHEMICVAVFPCSPYRYYSTKNYTPKHYDMIKQKKTRWYSGDG